MRRRWTARLRLILLLALDAAMVVMEWRVLSGIRRSSGAEMFRYYTQDSNILAMVLCLISLVCTLTVLFSGAERRPKWAKGLHHTAASCLMVTFLVAAFVLSPSKSFGSWRRYKLEFVRFMLRGDMLYMHTVCPLVMLGGFLILEEPTRLSIKNVLWSMLPTVAYGLVTLYMNIARVYAGPYFFFCVYEQPWYMTVIWMAVIIAGAFAVSALLMLASRLKGGRYR